MCRRKTNTCGEASVIELCRRRVGLGGGIGASSIPQLLDEDKKLDGDMEDALLCKECNIYGIKRVLLCQPPTNKHEHFLDSWQNYLLPDIINLM